MDTYVKSVQPIAAGLMTGQPTSAEGVPEAMTGLVKIERRPHRGRTANDFTVGLMISVRRRAGSEHELTFREDFEMTEILFGADAVVSGKRGEHQLLQRGQGRCIYGQHGLNGHNRIHLLLRLFVSDRHFFLLFPAAELRYMQVSA